MGEVVTREERERGSGGDRKEGRGREERGRDGFHCRAKSRGIYSFSRDSGSGRPDWQTKLADNDRKTSVRRINKGSHG